MNKTERDFLPTLAAHIVKAAKEAGGKAPSERELAEHFAVSRGQVREGLAILESMKVIERRAKSGIYLSEQSSSIDVMAFFSQAGIPLEPRQIYEAVELRKIHEIKAAELAAERATEENFERLREILRESEVKLSQGEPLAQLDQHFHLEIVRATQNSLFYNVCSSFYEASQQRLPYYFSKIERSRKSHSEHLQIFEALHSRDATLAKALMNSHLRAAKSYWAEILESPEPEK